MFDIIAICLVISALLAYVNHRLLKLPATIGVMVGALALSLALIGLDAIGVGHYMRVAERSLIGSIDFGDVLLQGMLSLLLFAGALRLNLDDLRAYRWQIIALAVCGTIASTTLIGMTVWWLLPYAGIHLDLFYCLVFGALISPTDPVAVMGILSRARAPKNLEVVITGESLFNDGIGVVLFALLLSAATTGTLPGWDQVILELLREAGGGLAFGFVLGYLTYRLLKSVDQYQVEVLLMLAAVVGGYALASHLGISAPLAMVVAGVMIGNRGRAEAMSDTTRRYVDMFWELIDDMLNAVLFVLVGMEVVLITFPDHLLIAAAVVIGATLLARLLTVGAPVALLHKAFNLPHGSWLVLSWGGLRGGISIALALSIPAGAARDYILALTYCVVIFSILIQGLTVKQALRLALPPTG
jgi:CPA1 family monovalent cation:H+ antiporter